MKEKEILEEIKKISKEIGFEIDKEIYRGFYYSKNHLRDIIYSGFYKGKSAILKFYDDPRITNEAEALEDFNKNNQSNFLVAPQVYENGVITPQSGWFIAERIPKDFKNLEAASDAKSRKWLFDLFLEYRKNFPTKPSRELLFSEELSAAEFHLSRINKWLNLAQKKEAAKLASGESFLSDEKFIDIYEKSLDLIRKEFENRKMIWSHGHFRSKDIFCNFDKTKIYLLDFGHVGMRPEGYELAFMFWADYLMDDEKWDMEFESWHKEIENWTAGLEKLAEKLNFKNPKKLIQASSVERLLGTIFADILSSDRNDKEKTKGVNLMKKLLEKVIEEYYQ